MISILDVGPLYCRLAMGTYLVFSVDQQLRTDEGRGVGHAIIGASLSEPHMVVSTAALSIYLSVCLVRPSFRIPAHFHF